MKKFLALTSNIGNKDILVDPDVYYDNVDYIAIVDRLYDVKIWKQQLNISFSNIDNFFNRRNAKIYKVLSTLFFPEYEYIIWMDANHNLNINPECIIDNYGNADLFLFKHPHRNCLYDEMIEIYKNGLDIYENLENQKKFYISENMPYNFGLCEMTCFIKKNNEKVKKLEMMWWEQICKFSSRDQTSMPYCLWKMINDKLIIKKLKGYANLYAGGNEYFTEREGHLL